MISSASRSAPLISRNVLIFARVTPFPPATIVVHASYRRDVCQRNYAAHGEGGEREGGVDVDCAASDN